MDCSNYDSDSNSSGSVATIVEVCDVQDDLNLSFQEDSTLPKEFFQASPSSREIIQVAKRNELELGNYINPLHNMNHLPNPNVANSMYCTSNSLPEIYLTNILLMTVISFALSPTVTVMMHCPLTLKSLYS